MAKIKLRKVFSKKEEKEMIIETARSLKISFQIIENKNIILEGIFGNKELQFSYPVQIAGLEIFEVLTDKEVPSFIKIVEFIVKNEVEKKSLAVEILDKYKEVTVFYNICERIVFISDIEKVAKGAFEEATKYISASYGLLVLYDEDKDEMKKTFEFRGDYPLQKIDVDSNLIRDIMKHGTCDILQDVSESRYKKDGNEIKSLIYVPVIMKNYIYGAFILGNHEKIEYSSGELKLASAIAFLLGVSFENSKLYNSLQDTFFQTVKALSETIEKRDTYTGGHVQRVMEYSLIIGEIMGLTEEEMDKLKLAALMHDIGKIGIEDKILRKNHGLSDEEYLKMKKHPVYGAEIIQNIKELREIIPGVREHHERFDGLGYPDGLQGDNITLLGRIIAVADTFDAMIIDRPYRKALKLEEAVNELKINAGKQFDPEVVEAFMKALDLKKIYKKR